MNKARELLRVAIATYQRGEHEIAKDIFVLAMKDGSVNKVFERAPDTESLKKAAAAAMAAGQYDEAIRRLNEIRANQEMSEEPGVDEAAEIDDDTEEEEASMSPGDVVEVVPVPDLAPAQVASIVALTRQIKAGGHEDLAAKITQALGL